MLSLMPRSLGYLYSFIVHQISMFSNNLTSHDLIGPELADIVKTEEALRFIITYETANPTLTFRHAFVSARERYHIHDT